MSRRLPALAELEYVRGKIEERDDAPTGRFDSRGNDVWAYRSGRTFYGDDMAGGAMDYSSPVTGNGRKMGKLSALTRKRSDSVSSSEEDETEYHPASGGCDTCGGRKMRGGATIAQAILGKGRPVGAGSPDYDTLELMNRGAERNVGGAKKTRKPSARGAMVSKLMREKGMTLGEASKYIKQHGLA